MLYIAPPTWAHKLPMYVPYIHTCAYLVPTYLYKILGSNTGGRAELGEWPTYICTKVRYVRLILRSKSE